MVRLTKLSLYCVRSYVVSVCHEGRWLTCFIGAAFKPFVCLHFNSLNIESVVLINHYANFDVRGVINLLKPSGYFTYRKV